jgi:uncharacterized protein with FMN-binding domain
MTELLKRALPGAAAATVAILSVLGLDAAFRSRAVSAGPAAGEGATALGQDVPRSGGSAQGESQPASCATTDQVTGAGAGTPWGPVQVVAEVDGAGQLCGVRAVAYPSSDPRSSMINSRAIPALDQAASRDGIRFDAVSGATYTSAAYRQSLQSVLDSL